MHEIRLVVVGGSLTRGVWISCAEAGTEVKSSVALPGLCCDSPRKCGAWVPVWMQLSPCANTS